MPFCYKTFKKEKDKKLAAKKIRAEETAGYRKGVYMKEGERETRKKSGQMVAFYISQRDH